MSRYGKKKQKKNKKQKNTVVQNTENSVKSSGPIFNPQKYKEHLVDLNSKGKPKPIDEEEMKKMGFTNVEVGMMKDSVSIKSQSPFMTIAQCVRDIKFSRGGEKLFEQTLLEGDVYVMALGMYETLYYNPQMGKKVLKPYKIPFKDVFNRYEGQDLDNKTVLIWRTGGIGDLLFIKPNLEYIKKRWPTSRIWFACAKSYQQMVKHWPEVDKLLDLPINYHTVFRKADYHVTFEGAIERNLEAHEKNAYELFSEWMGLNLKGEDLIPHQDPPAELIPKVKSVLENWKIGNEKFVLIQTQPSSPIRAIAPQKWVEVIDELTERGHKVVLTDNPLKTDQINALIKQCKNQNMIFNFAPHSVSLDYTIALCSFAKLALGPDSSLCHIAGSLDIPTFGIFGPFTGEVRLSYFPKADWINFGEELPCQPCFMHGVEPCDFAKKESDKFSPCLKMLNVKVVVDRCEKLIERFAND